MSDYLKMWEDLGMDLETHDALCQVLPTAFGDVYLSQENRPEAMGFWDFVVSEIHGIHPSELIEAQKKGRKVFGTICVYVPDELCDLASMGGGASISSMCTVFAESEVISLIGSGEKKENIAFAVVDSIVKKVASQARRLEGEGGAVCLTGGLCECGYIVRVLSDTLKKTIVTRPEAHYAGAIGAALTAMKT